MSRGTFARRAIGDVQVPVQRVARLGEHGGSVSRGAGRETFMPLKSVPHNVLPQVIPEGAGPVKTNGCVVLVRSVSFLSWLGASK